MPLLSFHATEVKAKTMLKVTEVKEKSIKVAEVR